MRLVTAAGVLTERATAALQRGELAAAEDGFARSAAAHLATGDRAAASIGFRLAALVAMLSGRLHEAEVLAERALAQVGDDERLRFAALVALAEVHRLDDRPAEAADRLTEAIAVADRHAGERPVASTLEVSALLRRRAGIHQALGAAADAVADLRRAAAELAASGEPASAAATDLELFGVLHDTSAGEALDALAAARARAVEADDPGIRAQVEAVEGSAALDAGDLTTARTHLASARDGALLALDPGTYLAAVSGLAVVADRQGDRQEAYATLTSAWATLSDLLGRDVAVAAIRPQLLALRERWGDAAFAAVKDAHDAARRTSTATASGPPVS